MSFHRRHCAEKGDCPLRATCEVKNFPDGHTRNGCRIEDFAENYGYKHSLATEENLTIARGIVNDDSSTLIFVG